MGALLWRLTFGLFKYSSFGFSSFGIGSVFSLLLIVLFDAFVDILFNLTEAFIGQLVKVVDIKTRWVLLSWQALFGDISDLFAAQNLDFLLQLVFHFLCILHLSEHWRFFLCASAIRCHPCSFGSIYVSFPLNFSLLVVKDLLHLHGSDVVWA